MVVKVILNVWAYGMATMGFVGHPDGKFEKNQ